MIDRMRMREIGRKGGNATKARAEKDATFFSRIGALGGKAGAGKPKPRRNEQCAPVVATKKEARAELLGDLDALIAELTA